MTTASTSSGGQERGAGGANASMLLTASSIDIEDIDEASDNALTALLSEARTQQLACTIDDDVLESEASTGKLSVDAFERLAHLADGAYSVVEIARRCASRRIFALKCIDKGLSRVILA